MRSQEAEENILVEFVEFFFKTATKTATYIEKFGWYPNKRNNLNEASKIAIDAEVTDMCMFLLAPIVVIVKKIRIIEVIFSKLHQYLLRSLFI
jgi:hypothetical protein